MKVIPWCSQSRISRGRGHSRPMPSTANSSHLKAMPRNGWVLSVGAYTAHWQYFEKVHSYTRPLKFCVLHCDGYLTFIRQEIEGHSQTKIGGFVFHDGFPLINLFNMNGFISGIEPDK